MHLRKTLRRAEELQHRPEQAEVRFRHARMLVERGEAGDAERAKALLEEARELCAEIGMARYGEMVDALRERIS